MRLVKKLTFSFPEANLVVDYLNKGTQKVNPSKSIVADFPEAQDVPILQLAAESDAQYLVTGDKLLLSKKKFKRTKIITARETIKYL